VRYDVIFFQDVLGNEEQRFEVCQVSLLSLPFRLVIRLAEVKNERSCTSTPLKYLHDVDGTNLPLPTFLGQRSQCKNFKK